MNIQQRTTEILQPGSGLTSPQQKVMHDTYRLLAMMLIFAATLAYVAMQLQVPVIHPLIMVGVYLVSLFLLNMNINKPSALIWTFVFCGWLGFTTGPIISLYLAHFDSSLVINALAATGLTFLGASVAGRVMPRLMSSLYSMFLLAVLIAFPISLLNVLIFESSVLHSLLSGVVALCSTFLIAGVTARIVRNEEVSHVQAAALIFVSLLNIFYFFLSLLRER